MFIAINTQPLIAQPVNALARFMTTANSELYVLAKGVLRYLKGVKSRKIVWCASRVKFPFVPCEIYAYSDASWADIVPQRKSSLSYLIFCNNAVFSWKSSLSSVLAMSSAEAELIALCACAADVAYCRKLANELGFLQLRPTIIHEDNLGAKQIAESGNFKGAFEVSMSHAKTRRSGFVSMLRKSSKVALPIYEVEEVSIIVSSAVCMFEPPTIDTLYHLAQRMLWSIHTRT
jgi:hypothetical protein